MDPCQIDPMSDRQKKCVNLSPADDEYFLHIKSLGLLKDLIHTGDDMYTRCMKFGVAGNDQVLSARQWFTKGFICFSSHHHGHTPGQVLEMFEIVGQVPGHAPVQAYGPIPGCCNDK